MPILIWLFFAILVGFSAMKHGRSFWVWFLLSVFISPLLAFVILKVISGR